MSNHSGSYMLNEVLTTAIEEFGLLESLGKEKSADLNASTRAPTTPAPKCPGAYEVGA